MLLLHDEAAERCPVAPGFGADAEFGGRAGPFMHELCSAPQAETLGADADFNA